MKIRTLVTGFPRIGEKRELKKALESFWVDKITEDELLETAAAIRKKHLLCQKNKGIDLISCNDFSLYDTMLDTAIMLNAIPERFNSISEKTIRYFTMARGCDEIPAMEMTKWFNTNYHYIVPELHEDMQFSLDASKIITEYKEAKSLGITPKINIIGPLTFLGLSKDSHKENCYDYFDTIIVVYEALLKQLASLDTEIYLQIDEPILVKKPSEKQLKLLEKSLSKLCNVSRSIKIIVATYFEHIIESIPVLAKTDIWGIGLDFVHGSKNIEAVQHLNGKNLIAGVVDGRNIWINNIEESVSLLERIKSYIPEDNIIVSTSCSLLHVPFSTVFEEESAVKNWFSFACEKLDEIVLISKIFRHENLSDAENEIVRKNKLSVNERKIAPIINNQDVQKRIKSIVKLERDEKFEKRVTVQRKIFDLPPLPTTTIGSFPQTEALRKLRNDYKKGQIGKTLYEIGIKNYIDECIAFQEDAGLDVLVHGEPERNDMVEYFGEMLNGFFFTVNGWVQSYGSRCVKPPVIYGDVSRPKPMTVGWITYAQSKTKKIMKGMLTGPVTILNWSFVRDDLPRSEVSRQIALAICDEVADLQAAGIKIIQVDEAAFKEGYPVRKENIPSYEEWAVNNFKLAVSSARKETQIHTHMCYSEFNEIVKTLEAMDADVITIETARSGNELLDIFKKVGYRQDIGPGVYDIHSPRIPSVDEMEKQILELTNVFATNKLWVNPDCGLKTRKWEEVKPALQNMVKAAKSVRMKVLK